MRTNRRSVPKVGRDNASNSRILEADTIVALGPVCGALAGNPCSLAEISLFPNAGKTPAKTLRTGRVGDTGLRRKLGSGQFPCIFPVDQGLLRRAEFAIDCTHRHSVRECGDSRANEVVLAETTRDSAGSWPNGPMGRNRRRLVAPAGSPHRRRSSPVPIAAVRRGTNEVARVLRSVMASSGVIRSATVASGCGAGPAAPATQEPS